MHRFVVFISPIVSSIIQINSWCYCWLGLAGGRCRWCGGCRWVGRRPAPRSTGTPARSSGGKSKKQMREHKVGGAVWQLTYLLQLLSPSRRPFVWILNLRGPSSHLSTCSAGMKTLLSRLLCMGYRDVLAPVWRHQRRVHHRVAPYHQR